MSARDVALKAFDLGIVPIPVGWRTKVPTDPQSGEPLHGWQNLFVDAADLDRWFSKGTRLNVGFVLGGASRGLVDIDLDSDEANELAVNHLPATRTSGRASKPRSHWWYFASKPLTTKQYRDPISKKVICELRSTGAQTVVHGEHPSGEAIEWQLDGEIATVDATTLAESIRGLAIACLQTRYGEGVEEVDRQIDRWMGREPVFVPSGAPRPSLDVEERADLYVRAMPPAISGAGGHVATFGAACALVRGFRLSVDAAWPILLDYNRRCSPPWSESDLRRKLVEARDRSIRAWGYIIDRSAA